MSQSPNSSSKYTYENAGFNGFMNRSLRSNPLAMTASDQISASSGGSVNLDMQQLFGSLGNVLNLGRIKLDGVAGRIIVADDNDTDLAWFGDLT